METKLIKIWICKKCGWEWANRKGKMPRLCPHCKSVRWND